ncbi:MAG: hypothetical protein ABIS67_03835, partial [Candidatus Eisenbacteria bacterium]
FLPVGPWTWRFSTAALLALAACGLAGAGFVVARAWRENRAGLLRAAGILLLAPLLGFVLATSGLILLRFLKGVDQPGYAHPAALFVVLASLAWLAGLVALRLDRAHRVGSKSLMAAGLLPWAAFAILTVVALPASSGFFVLPLPGLAAAGVLRFMRPGRRAAGAGLVVALAAVLLVWAEPLTLVLPMLVTTIPKLGPEPLFLWPAVFALLGFLFVPVGLAFLPERSAFGPRGRRSIGIAALAALAAAALVVARPAHDRAHPRRVWTYLVGRTDTAYVVTASPDRLGPPGARGNLADRGGDPAGEAGDDLFWLAGWYRRERATRVRLLLPQVTTRHEADRWIVEVRPGPDADAVVLSAEGTRLTATQPPSESRSGRRVVLRQVVGPERLVRFTLVGEVPPQARVQVFALGTALPQRVHEELVPERAALGQPAFMDRTVGLVELEAGWQER